MRQGRERPQQEKGPREDPVKVSHVGAPVRDGLSQTVGDSKAQPSRLASSLSGIAAEAGSAVLASALREAGPMLQQPGVSDLVQHGSGPLDILAAAHQRLSQPSPFAQVATSYLRRQGGTELGMGAMQAGSDEVDFAELRVSWAAWVDGGRHGWWGAACDMAVGTMQAECGLEFTGLWVDWEAYPIRGLLKVGQACIYLRLGIAWHTIVKLAVRRTTVKWAAGHAVCRRGGALIELWVSWAVCLQNPEVWLTCVYQRQRTAFNLAEEARRAASCRAVGAELSGGYDCEAVCRLTAFSQSCCLRKTACMLA